jgi:hypothetical protein
MRIVAMKLHTKDQAPKEGEQKAAEKPFPKVGLALKQFHQEVVLSNGLPQCALSAATLHHLQPVRNA